MPMDTPPLRSDRTTYTFDPAGSMIAAPRPAEGVGCSSCCMTIHQRAREGFALAYAVGETEAVESVAGEVQAGNLREARAHAGDAGEMSDLGERRCARKAGDVREE